MIRPNTPIDELQQRVDLMERLADLTDRIDQSAIGQSLKATAPIIEVVAKLCEVGLETLEERDKPVVRMLSPAEIREELGVSDSTILNYRKRWPWFRESYGKGKGQRYESTLVERVKEALKAER